MAQSREGSAYLGDTGKASQRKQLELSLEIWVPSARLVGVEGDWGEGRHSGQIGGKSFRELVKFQGNS